MSFFGPITPPGLSETSAPLVRRTIHRARVLGSFAAAQAGVQVIGFLSGILLVRYLDQHEYAYFTIANTMQGTINVLADIGISVGLISIGGRVWQDPHRFGELITTARHLRWRLGTVAAAIVTPLLYFMLVKNGASAAYATLLVLLVLAGLALQFSVNVFSVVPRLRSDIGRIQTIDLTGAIARLFVLVVLMFLFLNAGVAVAVGSAAVLLQYVMLRSYVRRVVDLQAGENAEDGAAMRAYTRSLAANAFSLAVLAAAAFFPGAFLFVLGSKYTHLSHELVLMVGGAVASALTGAFWALNSSKAWIAGSWLYIPLTLATQTALIPFTDFSSVREVLIFNLLSGVPNLLLNLVLSCRGFLTLRPPHA
ncbi:MAG: hypothetical protein LC642_06600 [Verrucomicrobiaceae bacterium]|nr:hypothetical protein [Verrucomicrobiaceae bacterium]